MIAALVFALVLGGGFLLPWWFAALFGYGAGFFLGRTGARAFAGGFAGAALAWLACALVSDFRNQHLLSGKMGLLFHVPGPALLAITALWGGFTGGLGAWAGQALRAAVLPRLAPGARLRRWLR